MTLEIEYPKSLNTDSWADYRELERTLNLIYWNVGNLKSTVH
jgi:hypothetical protein